MKGLCFRCDYRADFLEGGRQPRFECGDVKVSMFGCYMYKPTKPVVLKKRHDDKRPQFAGTMLASRSEYAGEPEMELRVESDGKCAVLYWEFERTGKEKPQRKWTKGQLIAEQKFRKEKQK